MSVSNTAEMSTITHEAVWGIDIDPDQLPVLETDEYVLDLGCGYTDSKLIHSFTAANPQSADRIVRVDYFADNLRRNPGAPGTAVAADALHLPFASASFGAVITSELTPDNDYFCDEAKRQHALAREISRVLRTGGHWLAYNENIKLVDVPAGLVWESGISSPIQIAPYGTSHRLPLGIFHKQAGILTTDTSSGIEVHSDSVSSDYTRQLDAFYRAKSLVGPASNIPSVEIDGKNLPRIFASYVAPLVVGRCIELAGQYGSWHGTLVDVEAADPDQFLADLCKPNVQVTAHLQGAVTHLLAQAMYAQDLGLCTVDRCAGAQVVITPTQQLCDQLLAKQFEAARA